jgi:hypothetical protein
LVISLNLVLAGLRLGLKNRQVGEKWVSDDCSYLCKGLHPKTTNHKTTLKYSKQSHYILTDNILLSTIEKIATSYQIVPIYAKVSTE